MHRPTSPLNILPSYLLFFGWDTQYFLRCLSGGGALMDLGVYCLYLAIEAAGEPIFAATPITQFGWSLWSDVLIYQSFQVANSGGKNFTSHLPAEIYCKTGTLTLNAVTIHQARFVSHLGEVIDLLSALPTPNARRGGSLPAIAHQARRLSRMVTNSWAGHDSLPDASKRWNTI